MGGSWCAVQGACHGKPWDYCSPRESHAPVAPSTTKGGTCRSSGQYACATGANGFCCNGDGDPNGPWCLTSASAGERIGTIARQLRTHRGIEFSPFTAGVLAACTQGANAKVPLLSEMLGGG